MAGGMRVGGTAFVDDPREGLSRPRATVAVTRVAQLAESQEVCWEVAGSIPASRPFVFLPPMVWIICG